MTNAPASSSPVLAAPVADKTAERPSKEGVAGVLTDVAALPSPWRFLGVEGKRAS